MRLLPFLLCVAVSVVHARDTIPDARLNVFLDCPNANCDFDFFRTELTSVNWVRDRQVADVHVLVTEQQTGAGGDEYTLTFIGLRRFTGMVDTLRYVSSPVDTEDEERRGVARMLALGLVRYVARTPGATRVVVNFGAREAGAAPPRQARDRWNNWVFDVSVSGFMSGERSYQDINLGGSFEADRITDAWKTRFDASESYNEEQNTITDCDDVTDVCRDTTFKFFQRSYDASLLQVRSLSSHWSAGLRASLESSTFRNYKRVLRAAPAIEFNVFPYSQSTRRQLRVEYNIGYADYAFNDTTIRDRIREMLPNHQLQINGEVVEPWGNIEIGVSGTSYLNDRTLYRLGSFAEIELRLFKGFSFEIDGGYDVIRDQFALAKKDFSPEEILTRQFQQSTTYSYFTSIGFSYTFGSIFNNVVNPRMN